MKETMRGTHPDEPMAARQLWLPVQAAPIDRTSAGVALAGDAGVEPSFAWLPLAATALSALL